MFRVKNKIRLLMSNRILFLTRNIWYSDICKDYINVHFPLVKIVSDKKLDKNFAKDSESFDYIIAFGYQYILPAEILLLAKKGAINIHPDEY